MAQNQFAGVAAFGYRQAPKSAPALKGAGAKEIREQEAGREQFRLS
jgi:hypothetical protein